jgi:ribosome-binding factor A
MTQARTQRIEAEIQRVLAALLAREVKDPRVGNVTITAVSLAADMSSARVFFTPFASRAPPEQVRGALSHAAGFLRRELGRALSLRHAPRLEFVFDDSVEGAARLTSLIDRAVAGDAASAAAHARPADAAPAPPAAARPAAADAAPPAHPAPERACGAEPTGR